MTTAATLLLHTSHEPLARQICAVLDPAAQPVRTQTGDELLRVLRRQRAPVLLLDLFCEEARQGVARWMEQVKPAVIIALGDTRTEAARQAEASGAFAVLEPSLTGLLTLPAVIGRATQHAQLQEENRQLRAVTAQSAAALAAPAPAPARPEAPLPLRHFARMFRHFDHLEAMLERSVEALASATGVARAGLVARLRGQTDFRLMAGMHCLDETRRAVYDAHHPFVCWLETHALMASRLALEQTSNAEERMLLQQMLDESGAEVLAPLHARGGILGWLLLGRRTSGRPFSNDDLEEVALAADHVASALENALLYEEVARQKSMAETLLHALPTGVVAADENGVVRWFSVAASQLLNLTAEQAVGRPVEILGSRMADQLRRAIAGESQGFPEIWRDPLSRRALVVQTQRLGTAARVLGSVAVIQDLTAQQALQEKQDQLERTAFWTELAASMSHEIRNPLVAIKTFAQLLPERYKDSEFRTSFSTLVSAEVDRLNSIIDQINDFAHPPSLKFHQVDLRDPLKLSVDLALPQGARDGLKVETRVPADLPPVWGDDRALADCFAHLVRNSAEALVGRADGTIHVEAVRTGSPSGNIQVTVRDNGPGIPDPLRDKIFSPFCTTKPRGMGLGLPIVKRTVVDHNGRVDVKSGKEGTTVTILLPANGQGE
jgi:nitrogen-specific signal transduction histidine kinase